MLFLNDHCHRHHLSVLDAGNNFIFLSRGYFLLSVDLCLFHSNPFPYRSGVDLYIAQDVMPANELHFSLRQHRSGWLLDNNFTIPAVGVLAAASTWAGAERAGGGRGVKQERNRSSNTM